LRESKVGFEVGKHLISCHGWGWQDAVVLVTVSQILAAPFHFEARDWTTRKLYITGLTDFLIQLTKMGKMYQMNYKL
jgi:hypothetical protein